MYSAVLHLTDLNDTHFHMCEQAAQIAARFNTPIYLLHVIEIPPSLQLAQGLGFAEIDYPQLDDARTVLQTIGEALHIPSQYLLVKSGSIKVHALETITQFNCDLLIIGQHAHHFLPSVLDNSAQDLSNQVRCDVLILR